MSKPQISQETRSKKRFPMSMRVEISHPVSGEASIYTTRDISRRGIFVYTDKPLPENSPIQFTMKLRGTGAPEEGVHVLCTGTVVRVEVPAGDGNVGIAATIDSFRFLNSQKGNA